MKNLLTIIFACVALCTFASQNDAEARKLLDITAKRLRNTGGISTRFTVTSLVGKQIEGTTNGTMYIKENKFQMTTPAIMIWFDGKTMWSLQQGDSEVTITEPTGTELQEVNPYNFLYLYKKGYNCKMKRGKMINGKEGYRLFLTANKPSLEIRELCIEIDDKYNPVRISARRGKNKWTRIVLMDFNVGHTISDAEFRFQSKDFPKATIIDLR